MTEKIPIIVTPPSTRWVDGLRGLAAVFVVSSHLTLGYAEHLTAPSPGEHGTPRFYHYPFIRVFAEGFPWVAIFLVLTGFVNALKPIKQSRAGRSDSALSSLSSSCFRRTSRLVLPCTVATVMSWIICELGGYQIGTMVESGWMNGTSPDRSRSVGEALCTLGRSIWDTWANYSNELERNQWTMLWFLKGSLVLYVTLLAVVRATSRFRMAIFAALFVYGWRFSDAMMFLPIFGGAFLAELSMEQAIIKFSQNRSYVTRLLPFSMVFLGWYLCSYPNHYPEWQPWSNALWHTGMFIFPEGGEVYSLWSICGVLLITTGTILSLRLQKMLSHPILLWLGAQSFPIYLIHGPLLRSFLNWMLYALAEPKWYQEFDDEGNEVREFPRHPIPAKWKFLAAVPVFYAMLFYLAHIWTQKIESRCGTVTKWLEETMCGIGGEQTYSEILLSEDQRTSREGIRGLEGTLSGNLLPT